MPPNGILQRSTTSSVTNRILTDGGDVYIGSRPPAQPRKSDGTHEGGSSFGVAYVNDIGRDAMSSQQPTKFPIGSIIVREKLISKDDTQPQLLAVMVKRAQGFYPKGGDWEYFVVDGRMTKVRERQKKGVCNDCHFAQKDRDFVFALPVAR